MMHGCFWDCALWCTGAAHAAQGIGPVCCRGLQQRSTVTGANRACHVCVWAAELSPYIQMRSHLLHMRRASGVLQKGISGSSGSTGGMGRSDRSVVSGDELCHQNVFFLAVLQIPNTILFNMIPAGGAL